MYFEAIAHKVREVKDCKEAAELIKSDEVNSWTALKWSNANGTFYAVGDLQFGDFGETAFIRESEESTTGFFQTESITDAWCDLQKLKSIFKESEKSDAIRRTVDLIIGKPKNQVAWFECGCCGKGFRDSVKRQSFFDQDAGFGICKDCEKYYL